MNSMFQNEESDWSASTNGQPQLTFDVTSSVQTTDEPHAVFALGNFFGDGNVFVKIPWQSLQLAQLSKSLNINIIPTEIIAGKSVPTNAASLEIKRDASGCIRVTARKNLDQATSLHYLR